VGSCRESARYSTRWPPEFTKTVHNKPLLERFFRLSMGVLLNIEGKCSPLRATPAHFSGHLPDPYDASRVLSSALVCPHVLSGAAVFPLLAPSWPCLVGSSQAHFAPPPPAPPRTPDDCPACRHASTASSGARPAPLPVRPWREVKSRRGAPKRVKTEGFACPNRKCLYFRITESHIHAASWRWQAWPC
jgi:hypothetical protein